MNYNNNDKMDRPSTSYYQSKYDGKSYDLRNIQNEHVHGHGQSANEHYMMHNQSHGHSLTNNNDYHRSRISSDYTISHPL
jgi:hypothetical protein